MRLAWCSDTHFDFLRSTEDVRRFAAYVGRQADAVLLTGDISTGRQLQEHLEAFADGVGRERAVYFVLGNHDVWHMSFDEAKAIARDVAMKSPNLFYLDGHEPIDLGGVMLMGSDGFYDARCGKIDGDIYMNDWARIRDLREALVSGLPLYLQERGRVMAQTEAAYLRTTPPCQRLIYATHVPPFPGLVGGDARAWYVNLALGRELADFADERPECAITVLAGHVHTKGRVDVRNNLLAMTARAEYGQPAIARVFDLEKWAR